MKTIGILGGMGPEATILLYERIVKYTEGKCDQDNIPTIIYSNTQIPDRTKAILYKGTDPIISLIYSAKVLEDAGANLIIMPCNTAHFYYKQIEEEINIDFLNMVHLTRLYIMNKFLNKKIGVFATSGTLKTGIYGEKSFEGKVNLIHPNEIDQGIIMDIIYNGIKSNKSTLDTTPYKKVIKQFEGIGVDAIILGCTELSVLHNHVSFDTHIEFIDPLEILAKSAVKEALAK
ncbi:aspartate racemase [Clostridium aceticum]|uniref:Aspartate racemase n=1 Tax=Clostridium aceticum TaxID=84022 RepID=A0A0D8IBM1_9CLOT|nr:amino acid racemase [Clostridium aceticum]AKL96481.1 aspartate racemase [Clostridium aceticum]KJF27347.1 hypothetical protein TZ02_08400 [Clostridium aceticum]